MAQKTITLLRIAGNPELDADSIMDDDLFLVEHDTDNIDCDYKVKFSSVEKKLSDKISDSVVSEVEAKIYDKVYPVGTLYWSSVNINPAELFGIGTWTQIKDKFILAAGDTYTAGETGGNAEVTLSVDNLPSHSHSMSHTHTYSGTTGAMSGNSTGHYQQHTRGVTLTAFESATSDGDFVYTDGNMSLDDSKITLPSNRWRPDHAGNNVQASEMKSLKIDVSHTHSYSGTTKTQSTSTTGTTGSGTAFDNMPPYEVYFCWKRIA